MEAHELLLKSFHTAVAAADPLKIIPAYLPNASSLKQGKTLVIGAGKAAASMAKAVEDNWPSDAPLEGLVITRYGHGLPTKKIRVIEAGHPVPDEAGERAAQEILSRVQALQPGDRLLALVSGGGSSLLAQPVDGLSMSDLKAVTAFLLMCGATIQEINTVRKHLSRVQGGRLAQVAAERGAQVAALIISDVTGDDPTHIASGPTAPDPTTYADALAVLAHYNINEPKSAIDILQAGKRGEREETLKPGDGIFKQVDNRMTATAHQSLEAAAEFLASQGYAPVILGDHVTGESREVAKVYGALAKEVSRYSSAWQAHGYSLYGHASPRGNGPRPPRQGAVRGVALISGGETTVTVRGEGRGGRNVEFLLSLAVELDGLKNVYALAADTDGIDGAAENAGAILTPDTLARARANAIDAKQYLDNNDGHGFFEALGDHVVTGATLTNVNDYRVILIDS
jgi:glycerate 2-kinase